MTLAAAFRADADSQMGVGHFMRCLSLACTWKERGGHAEFLTTTSEPALLDRLDQAGIPWSIVPHRYPAQGDLHCSVDWASSHPGQRLVLDGYHFDEAYQQAVTDAGARLLVIDDYVRLPQYSAHLLLDQNLNAESRQYPVPADCKTLLGVRYALLSQQYRKWQGHRKSYPATARRVLVTLGGADPGDQTSRAIRGLITADTRNFDAVVVVGSANPRGPEIERWANDIPNLRVVRNASNMPELMAWADIAIAAAGSTSWELAFMGLPSLVITVADNQVPNARALGDHGVAHILGWHADVSENDIAQALVALARDADARSAMGTRGQHLVDGRGAERVAAAMAGDDLD